MEENKMYKIGNKTLKEWMDQNYIDEVDTVVSSNKTMQIVAIRVKNDIYYMDGNFSRYQYNNDAEEKIREICRNIDDYTP